MKVQNKETKKTHIVYHIRYDKKGYPHFLIYENGMWLTVSAKHYQPIGA